MNAPTVRRAFLASVIVAAAIGLYACSACTSSKVEGTYTDANGVFRLELKSGGAATWTAMNDSTQCTYKVDGKQVTVQCENQTMPFTLLDDGSLAPPAGSPMAPLKKKP